MNVHDFFAGLAKQCKEGNCEGCGAREFCYTAPGSITEELINQTIDRMHLAGDGHKCTERPIR